MVHCLSFIGDFSRLEYKGEVNECGKNIPLYLNPLMHNLCRYVENKHSGGSLLPHVVHQSIVVQINTLMFLQNKMHEIISNNIFCRNDLHNIFIALLQKSQLSCY